MNLKCMYIFQNLISHMFTNSKKKYLFLTIKHNTYVMIWFLNVDYGKGFMHNWMCERARNFWITCDITNHSRCATKYNHNDCC